MKGGAKVVVEPHRHEGVFIARGKEDALCTLNSAPGKVGGRNWIGVLLYLLAWTYLSCRLLCFCVVRPLLPGDPVYTTHHFLVLCCIRVFLIFSV